MVPTRALSLALCVALLSAGAVAALPSGGVSPPAALAQSSQSPHAIQTPAVLSVGAERSNFTGTSVSVTGALANQQTAVTADLRKRTITERLDRAANESERRAILADAVDTLAARADRIAGDAQSARQRYVAGDLTTRAYSAQLAAIHSRAGAAVDLAQFLEERAAAGSATKRRAVEVRARLSMYTGPIRAEIADAMVSGSGPSHVYVSAGASGTALAVIEGDTYVREASDPSGYTPESGPIPDADTLLENVRGQYPWVMNQSPGISFVPIPIDTDTPRYAFVLTLNYPKGSIHSHVDTSSNAVYQEVQRIQLSTLNTTPDRVVREQGVRLAVSRSFAGGPLYVNATREDGSPASVRVFVNNESVGTTGPDGTLWTLEPGGEFTVAAAAGPDTRVAVNVTATASENVSAVRSAPS